MLMVRFVRLIRERHGPDNLDNLRKLFEKQAPGAVVKAQLVCQPRMDDDDLTTVKTSEVTEALQRIPS
ncbi:hypothetical protein Tco_1088976, partial [Tanacetum coccineum]